MQYPERLIDKAKKLYPRWTQLHELMEKGSPCVMHLLHERQAPQSIPIATVLNAETIEELHALAYDELDRAELYLEMIAFVENDRKERNARRLREIEEAHDRGETLT